MLTALAVGDRNLRHESPPLKKSALTRCIAAIVFTISLVAIGQVPASAEDGNETGGDVTDLSDDVSPEVQAQARAKMAGEKEWWKVSPDYQPPSGVGIMAAPSVERAYAGVRHVAQSKSYYCGPASGKMILKTWRAGRSAYNGARQTQRSIGGPNHMRTDANGKTGWASDLFRIGLNKWLNGGNGNGWYISVDSPTVRQFKTALRGDIQMNSLPFGADTVEFPREIHYNSHPKGKLIGHWLTTVAFRNYGNKTRFADPATSLWPGVNKKFWYKTRPFVNRFLQNNGITW